MKPGAILTQREAEQMLHRLTRIEAVTRDRRIREHCRLGRLTINAAVRRGEKYNREQEGILFRFKSII